MNFEKSPMPFLENQEKSIDAIVTAKGSIYKYLPDGTIQRFKKVEGKEYEPQSALVFVPDYETLKKAASKKINLEQVFGDNESEYEQSLLEYVQGKEKKCYIVNTQGKKLETNQEIATEPGQVFLTFGSEDKVDFIIPVAKEPKIGYSTFDSRKYYDDEEKTWKRERHLGNKIIEIKYK